MVCHLEPGPFFHMLYALESSSWPIAQVWWIFCYWGPLIAGCHFWAHKHPCREWPGCHASKAAESFDGCSFAHMGPCHCHIVHPRWSWTFGWSASLHWVTAADSRCSASGTSDSAAPTRDRLKLLSASCMHLWVNESRLGRSSAHSLTLWWSGSASELHDALFCLRSWYCFLCPRVHALLSLVRHQHSAWEHFLCLELS